MAKIAINGLGRIGRPALKIIIEKPTLELVAVNDLTDPVTLAHLIKYDSVYGKYEKEVLANDKWSVLSKTKDQTSNVKCQMSNVGELIIDKKKILIFAEKDPENLPWGKLGIDIVLECTGLFTDKKEAAKHLKAGAKKVIISANAKTEEVPHFVLGVNEENYDSKGDNVIAMGSCTTNCLGPIARILNDNFKIKKGFMATVHSYTNTQRILDLAHENLREARAAALNIIPTVTGAAKAIDRIIPELKGKLDGIAMRVPTPTVSIVDFIALVSKKTSAEEVNKIFRKESQNKLKGILAVSNEPLVSSDYKKNPHSAIVDLSLTMVKDDLVKVVAWYDNEWGYACRLVEMAEYIG